MVSWVRCLIVSIPDLCLLPYLNEAATTPIPLASAQFIFFSDKSYQNMATQYHYLTHHCDYIEIRTEVLHILGGITVGHCRCCEHVLNVHAE